jgi:hypothetical protein
MKVRVELGRPAEVGIWCDTCLLPSAIRWPIFGLYEHGLMDLGTLLVCRAHVDVRGLELEAARRVAQLCGGGEVLG